MKLIQLNQITRDKSTREIAVNPKNITYIFVRDDKTMVQFVGSPDNGIFVMESIDSIKELISNI